MIKDIVLIVLLGLITLILIYSLFKISISRYQGKINIPEYCSMVCKDCSNANFAILFTIHNTTERKKMYKDVIQYWLSDCKLPQKRIYVVSSGNLSIDTNLVLPQNQVIFDQKIECPDLLGNKSNLEIFSIRKAINELNFGDAEYIFKITGKYKIPQLCDIKLDGDLILQNVKTWYDNLVPFLNLINSEIIGFRRELFGDILNKIDREKGNMLEKKLYNLVKNNKNITIQRLPKLINDARYIRGAYTYMKYL